MSDRQANQLVLIGIVMLAGASAAASWWNARLAAGLFAGGAWNLVSLWCLRRMLSAWLGPRPSRRRAVGWLLVKFPLLYGLVFVMLRASVVSLIGFGIGFSLVLILAVGWFAVLAQRLAPSRSYGR